MVDVAVEILSCTVPVPRDSIVFVVKTWWTQIEVEGKDEASSYVKLPVLPMIEQFYRMKAKKNFVFVEVWYCNDQLFPPGTRRFLGMAKSLVDNLLAHPQASPCMEWLDVYDPIEDFTRGKMLMKVHAHFSSDKDPEASAVLPSPAVSSNSYATSRLYSSYFGAASQNNKDKDQHRRLPHSSLESSPFSTRSIPVQTENESDKPTPDFPTRQGQPSISKSNGDFQTCDSTPASTLSSSAAVDNKRIRVEAICSRGTDDVELIVTGKSCLSSRQAVEETEDPVPLRNKATTTATRGREQNHNVKFSESTAFNDTQENIGQPPESSSVTNNNNYYNNSDKLDFQRVDDVIEIMKNIDRLEDPGLKKEHLKDHRTFARPSPAQDLRDASAKLQRDWKEYLAKRSNPETSNSSSPSSSRPTSVTPTNQINSNRWASLRNDPTIVRILDKEKQLEQKKLEKKQLENKRHRTAHPLDENRTDKLSKHIKPIPISSELNFSTKTTSNNIKSSGGDSNIPHNPVHSLPPRSKRIAAAIYNDYPDGLGK